MQTVTESAKKDLTWKAVSDASEKADLERRHPPRTYVGPIVTKLDANAIAEKISAVSDLRDRTGEFEDAKRDAALALKTHLAQIDSIVGVLCDGHESRDVELRETFHWDVGAVRIVRVDTGELVSERAIDADERQREMFGDDEDVNA